MKKILLTLALTLSFATVCHAQKASWEKLIDVGTHQFSTKSLIMSHIGADDYVGMLTQDIERIEGKYVYRKVLMKTTDCYSNDGQGMLFTIGKNDSMEDKESITLKNLSQFENSLASVEAKLICKKYADFIVLHTEPTDDMSAINDYQVTLEQFSQFNDYLGQPHITLKVRLIDNSTYDVYVEKFSVKKEDCDKKSGSLQRLSLDLKAQGMFHFDMSDKKKTNGNLSDLVTQICSQYSKLE